ncbi:MAG: thioredoxin domain-containing protein [Candidatus Methanofastidiosa archaeon]|nr:thioredoxin domain-containing protein [Candidatus Methanofastidiosa archaeon]
MPKGNVKRGTNRLSKEKSPYLLQHASNPVDWYPWCDEAFDRALSEDRPIFLSIGYSTCHWCHVMERESFEDEGIAKLLNEAFICIKVDREERPDLDQLYMKAAQMMIGSGGWPLNIVLTPEKVPFYAATYIPPDGRYGMIGMSELIPRIAELWKKDRERIMRSANSLIGLLNEHRRPSESLPKEDILLQAYDEMVLSFDEKEGGFGSRPKFPSAHNLLFLLRYWKRQGDPYALQMVERTLDAISRGGIRDHIGQGFHRYSTDERWLLPHFEKMLYDQALLAIAFSETYQETKKEAYKEEAEAIFGYVLGRMRSEEGLFLSAEDADSEGVEGAYYVWTYDELSRILSPEELSIAEKVYNVEKGGNYRDESSRAFTGKNVLHMSAGLDEISKGMGMESFELKERLMALNSKLYENRSRRPAPQKDDKILADWNCLMVAALAIGGRCLASREHVDLARASLRSILGVFFKDEGHLLHRFRDKEASIEANIDDYAFLVWALLEVYDTCLEPSYLEMADKMIELSIKHFWDDADGGFFMAPGSRVDLISRQKDTYDGALPSGNSVMAYCLLRASRLLEKPGYEDMLEKMFKAFSEDLNEMPSAHTYLMMAYDAFVLPYSKLVIVGDIEDAKEMIEARDSLYLPHNNTILTDPKGDEGLFPKLTRELKQSNGRPTAYVCVRRSCMDPTCSPEDMKRLLLSVYESR